MKGLFPEKDLMIALLDKEIPSNPNLTASSPALVGHDETLGIHGGCWCGRAKDHDWPGRDEKAPHPRYPE